MIRHVRRDEAARVKAARLRALADAPDAFGATYDGDAARPDGWWTMIATLSDAGEEQRTFVFEEDGEWLGFILIRRDDDHPPDAVINATWVAPQARGRGIAQALTRACVAWARERGFPAVGVAVTAGNAAAQRAYEATGFTPAFTAEWTEGKRTLNLVVLKQTL